MMRIYFAPMNEVRVQQTTLSIFEPDADREEGDTTSPIELYENGLRLGPAHSSMVDIKMHGKGRFNYVRAKHPGGEVRFSSSDNTNPMTNGRTYWVVHPNR
jgi:hypothetical protein